MSTEIQALQQKSRGQRGSRCIWEDEKIKVNLGKQGKFLYVSERCSSSNILGENNLLMLADFLKITGLREFNKILH